MAHTISVTLPKCCYSHNTTLDTLPYAIEAPTNKSIYIEKPKISNIRLSAVNKPIMWPIKRRINRIVFPSTTCDYGERTIINANYKSNIRYSSFSCARKHSTPLNRTIINGHLYKAYKLDKIKNRYKNEGGRNELHSNMLSFSRYFESICGIRRERLILR
jgi:hypothetical protein